MRVLMAVEFVVDHSSCRLTAVRGCLKPKYFSKLSKLMAPNLLICILGVYGTKVLLESISAGASKLSLDLYVFLLACI
jgi:hypothetical protein